MHRCATGEMEKKKGNRDRIRTYKTSLYVALINIYVAILMEVHLHEMNMNSLNEYMLMYLMK